MINIEEIKKLENHSVKDFEIIKQIEEYVKETGDKTLNSKICPYSVFKMKYPEIKTKRSLGGDIIKDNSIDESTEKIDVVEE